MFRRVETQNQLPTPSQIELQAYGTPEGVRKAWDKRGRGRKRRERFGLDRETLGYRRGAAKLAQKRGKVSPDLMEKAIAMLHPSLRDKNPGFKMLPPDRALYDEQRERAINRILNKLRRGVK